MGVFWDVFWAVACICGLAFVGWWLFGLLLRPLPGRTVRVVLAGRDGGEELEQQVKSFIWLRGLGLLRCPIVIADAGLTPAGWELVLRLTARWPEVVLGPAEDLGELSQRG